MFCVWQLYLKLHRFPIFLYNTSHHFMFKICTKAAAVTLFEGSNTVRAQGSPRLGATRTSSGGQLYDRWAGVQRGRRGVDSSRCQVKIKCVCYSKYVQDTQKHMHCPLHPVINKETKRLPRLFSLVSHRWSASYCSVCSLYKTERNKMVMRSQRR